MNFLLENYIIDVEYPEVSGAEHLQMLYNRDKLADLEMTLSLEEQERLDEADRRLIQEASHFYAALSSFVDLAVIRRHENISPSRWWWYLDVLSELPSLALPSHPTHQAA